MKSIPSLKDFWFLPLGGTDEIGMNLSLYGHDGRWIMVDCGVTFHDRFGIEVITPDISFIKDNISKLDGLIVTHAHEDHIGAIQYLWPELKCPVFATDFSAAVIKAKLTEVSWAKNVPITEVKYSSPFAVGKFEVEFIKVTHSIPEAVAIKISTPLGQVIHTGDWKIDPFPLIGETIDSNRLKELGDEGVLALLCDSTNVELDGACGSEAVVRENLTSLFSSFPDKRITVGCFASNVARIETIATAAKALGRSVCLLGKSLERMVKAAKSVNYLQNIPAFINLEQAEKMPHAKVLFISTGSQGEMRASFSKIASGQHVISMSEKDVAVFSSKIIPGNEKSIAAIQNKLIRSGATVITSDDADIHVSGHPHKDELLAIYGWVRPKILVPIHGDATHLYKHAKLAKEAGIEHVVIPQNGSLISLDAKAPKICGMIPTEKCVVDGNRVVNSKCLAITQRQKLSIEGSVFISVSIGKDGSMAALPQIDILGLCEDSEEVEECVQSCMLIIRESLRERGKAEALSESLQSSFIQFFSKRFAKKPIIRVHCFVK